MISGGQNDADGQTDEGFLLDVIVSHKLAWVRGLLNEQSLPSSGTQPELRSRIEEYLENGTLDSADLIGLLDEVEGWGDQHVYLYTASSALLADLADETSFKQMLKNNRALGLFNKQAPLVLPDTPKLSSVSWSADSVRFAGEKREYRDRIEDEDRQEDDLEFDAYEIRDTRGVISSGRRKSALPDAPIEVVPN